MSYYVNLRSSECKDVYPKNHGGNYTIELNEPLRLDGGPWEVALAEMTYHTEPFPNVPKEHSTVKVTLNEQLQVYDTRDLNFNIKIWVRHNNNWLFSDSLEIPLENRYPHVITLPKKNYDWEDFKAAIANCGNTQVSGATAPWMKLAFSLTDTTFKIDIKSPNRVRMEFSYCLQRFLSLKVVDVFQSPDHPHFIAEHSYIKPTLPKEQSILQTISESLSYNFYPTGKQLINELNNIILNCTSILNSKSINSSLFSINSDLKCSFIAHPQYTIELSKYLLNLLHLTNTTTTQTASSVFIMPASVREFLFINSNMSDSQTSKNETNVLRVINNNREAHEKVLASFTNLYYYPVSTRYLTNIQIHISDNHSTEDLPFTLEVTCLLHFRRCSNRPFS